MNLRAPLSTAAIAAAVLTSTSPASAEAAQRKGVRVEFAINAKQATFKPAGKGGTLKVSRIAPRMSVMEIAPRKGVAVMPASALGANWKRLFKRQGGVTNGIISAHAGDRHVTIPVRLKLKGRARNGERMTFTVLPMQRRGHRVPVLGKQHGKLTDVSLLIDPTVTDQLKALWNSLLSWFTTTPELPSDPTDRTSSGNGSLTFNPDGSYAGTKSQPAGTQSGWEQAQLDNLRNSGGTFEFDPAQSTPDVWLRDGGTGIALFNHDYGAVTVQGDLDGFALFESRVDQLVFTSAEVGGANLRGLTTDRFIATNSAFNGVDLTGSAFLAERDQRGLVNNAVFANVETNRTSPNDKASANPGLIIQYTDFTSTSFQNVDFAGAEITGSTFQGSGFMNVDFTGARISGPDASAMTGDGVFQPTFDNSIFDNVKFDGARLENVSFAGVDFSGGNVSLDGAVLANVDFTGAVGLQDVDWTKVKVEGNVYGLTQYSTEVGVEDPAFIRTMTFDGVVPEIDPATGLDIEPATGLLIDTESGVRLTRDASSGALLPVDPTTSGYFEDPRTGDYLQFRDGALFNPATGEEFRVDFETGEIER